MRIGLALVALVVVAALTSVYLVYMSGDDNTASNINEAEAIEDFGMALDLFQFSYEGGAPVPPMMRVLKDKTLGYIRGIYLEYIDTGETARVWLNANGRKDLGVGEVFSPSWLPELETHKPSAFVSRKGITFGASVDEVMAAYGESSLRSYPQMRGVQFVQYERTLPEGNVAIVAFTFRGGLVVAMNSVLYSPKEVEEWNAQLDLPPEERARDKRYHSELGKASAR